MFDGGDFLEVAGKDGRMWLEVVGWFRKKMEKVAGGVIFVFPVVISYFDGGDFLEVAGAKIEDLSSQLRTQAAQQFKMPDTGSVMTKPDPPASSQVNEEQKEIDETDVNARDIELLMTQAGVSRKHVSGF
ncbi:hypothetical protein AgCh_036878 [Apium graveolens]